MGTKVVTTPTSHSSKLSTPSNGAAETNGHAAKPKGGVRRDKTPRHKLNELLLALRAADRGDFDVRLFPSNQGQGVLDEIADAFNRVVARNAHLAREMERVERIVGREGRMTERVVLDSGVAGQWLTSIEAINALIGDLVQPTTEVARVISAVANGDLSKKISVDAKGEVLELKNTVNTMVDQLNSFAAEVTRVAKEVGTEGKLGGQAEVKGVSGVWKDLTDNVNSMASNLTAQVRNIADVTTSVAKGDLSRKITVDVKGEVLELKNTINTMVDQLNSFAAEVTRVAKEVGTEGKLGGQADVKDVAGTWKDLTDNVNFMATNLTTQVRGIARVVTAVANGDLTQRLKVEAKGEIASLADTINGMTKTLGVFAEQVTDVARTVGVEGSLGAQAQVPGVAGTWKDLTDNVNLLANNLTAQVRNIAEVTTSVAKGDLSKKITVDAKGEVLELKSTINTLVDQLNSFAAEVTRVAKEVGTEGKLGGQGEVKGVSGVWKDLTDNVNVLAANLTDQVRNIAKVTTAVATGDLSQKITVDAKGEVLALKNTINTMVDQLRSFASEVTRVAKEVGNEGNLGGQADVKGVSGTWKDLTDNVNSMASNLTGQVRNIAAVTTAVANGDLSKKITVDVRGEILELKITINSMVDQLNSFASEVTRVAREVGTEGRLGGQAYVPGVAGIWKNLTDNVNFMASNLTTQVRGIVKVVTAVANGDLRQKLVVEAKGEVEALAETINNMTDTLGVFAEQVSTVAREVGVEGKLGGQARVPGVAGTWKDLTDNVNFMASNLTTQVRGIVKVVTAVANGDLSQKLIGVEAKGEILALADTINNMCDTLGTFADQVSTVAREVGIEGKLSGQAKVPGAMGTWRQLTDNVNQLAANLTSQVRAISDVATAVTKGDLTRSIDVQAEGEVALLKDNINQMIVNLKETTQKNTEQDWLKTNLAKFSSMMQGQKDLGTVSEMIMSQLTPLVSAHHGAFYTIDLEAREPTLRLTSSYAYRERKHIANSFRLGEGIVGQCAKEKKTILLTRVPSDYILISSGLGEAVPHNIIVLPVLFEGQVKGVIELASFHPFSAIHQLFLDQLMESIGVVLNMITANMRTEELLGQSQKLTQELQSQSKELTTQQEEMRRTNLELEEKARLLAEQNRKVEEKNREVEQARIAVEEKAQQLALISTYKSEFLANMSHELRTPLNSLLILAKLLADNPELNLTPKQVEYARTIHASGGDLLALINEILDLSKVEAGKMQIEPRTIHFVDVVDFVERSFRPVADQKGLELRIECAPNLPFTMRTDPQRLQQVLKNLLSNAFKFTSKGGVTLSVALAEPRLFGSRALGRAEHVVAYAVTDTGIGIPKDKQRLIFEAFQQADGTTSRHYGGTGLGLSISREISRLLGGEIRVVSEPATGSTFTLYLPDDYVPVEELAAERAEGATGGSYLAELPEPTTADSHAVVDDRERIREGDRLLLIIEDDEKFAKILVNMAGESGFKAIVATRGDTGIALANEFMPHAITLDVQLPVIDGLSVFAHLKRNPRTRSIPIHVITVVEKTDGTTHGAFTYLEKPVNKETLDETFARISSYLDRTVRRLLIVDADSSECERLVGLLGEGEDVETTAVASVEEARARLEGDTFDCLVLGLASENLDSGLRLAEYVKTRPGFGPVPIVLSIARTLTPTEQQRARSCAESVIVKSGEDVPPQLVSDTCLFLHRVVEELPVRTRAGMIDPRRTEPVAVRKKILVVDDDVRNVFAMSSALEGKGLDVIYAENGKRALETLRRTPDIGVILMDIMMPEMDGFAAMKAIRNEPLYKAAPIIAVTAKALKEDRERCIRAGASDYLPKPIDTAKLLDMIGVWFH
jgi:HAMP domain-containing protein/signal transduction histidine kinase/CheY-like chemotaxis protein